MAITDNEANDLIDIVDAKEEYQIDKVKKTYVLMNHYWDTLEKNLSKHRNELIRFIAKYRNNNIDKLETPYPIDYPA